MQTGSFLITGASTGIGRACVDRLVADGAHVWATVRSDVDEKALADAHGDKVSVLRMDVTDAASIEAGCAKIRAAGPLNGVVNNAGIAIPSPLEYLPVDALRNLMEVNVIGQLAVTQGVLPALREARAQGQKARIVMLGSIGGRVAGPMLGAYHTSKFALLGMTNTLRAELAPSGIEVVMVEPGAITTPIWQRGAAAGASLFQAMPKAALAQYAKQIEVSRAVGAANAKRGLPASRAADVIATALTTARPRPRYLLGNDAHKTALINLLPFRLRYRLTAAKG